ncbi:MAG: GGDEF domain-containing protein [Proteobacteria bacterium]|nr:GGDEF domain-containing protein [Desulfocapsa sp.]MBU3945366.1 GGDEF domain-containing protein [Pseudomonadota bacterium]MCG2743314.1 GGDEF domain-containing protein [Desulfobacteraceae bacterium]MDO8947005.1 diguanylate cyclase [Desulfocapsaceae bacterium]MBU3982641.1 GGDEF domain-containing protein [Pseudomonadota bacterium]
MIFEQVFNMINVGLVVLDQDLNVRHWNRWMELHSNIKAEDIIGSPIFSCFPNLDNPKFLRNCKSVFKFGNFSFFSQKLHRYLFPFKPDSTFGSEFNHMQQSCTMGPLRDESNVVSHIYLSVQDVTEIAAYERKLVEKNMQDGLTGIYNRRFLDAKLQEEFSRHKRYNRPFSLIMCDIDLFKNVNDTYGHQCGDVVIKHIASLMGSMMRDTDFLARYGGEEFCCLLPEADFEVACSLAERLRQAIEQKEVTFDGQTLNITVSFGVAYMYDEVEHAEALLQMADDALYAAKKSGRNRVVAAP